MAKPKYKTCRECKDSKLVSMFYKKTANRDSCSNLCKGCDHTKRREQRAARKQKLLDSTVPIILPKDKHCPQCETTKTIDNFYINTSIGRAMSRCKACDQEVGSRRRAKFKLKGRHIYMIQVGDLPFVKIGLASNLNRISQIQVDCPYAVKILCLFPGSRKDEMILHSLLADYNTRGEWFEMSDQVKLVIKKKQKESGFKPKCLSALRSSLSSGVSK